VVHNDWRMVVKGPAGVPLAAAGKAVEVVRRQPDGTWRFALDDPFGRG
jgi:ketosteroid isomerase-like protein